MAAASQLFRAFSGLWGPVMPAPGAGVQARSLRVSTALQPVAAGLLARVYPLGVTRYFGTGRIAGTVRVLSAIAPYRRVCLYDRTSGRLARVTTSAADGSYSFERVDTLRQYYAIALDIHPGGYNATIEDLVVPS